MTLQLDPTFDAAEFVRRILDRDEIEPAAAVRTLRGELVEQPDHRHREIIEALIGWVNQNIRKNSRTARVVSRIAARMARRGRSADLEARALHVLGEALLEQIRVPAGMRYLDRSLALYGEVRDEHSAANVQMLRAYALSKLGRHAETQEAIDAAQKVFRRIGDRKGLGQVESALAGIELERGRFRSALRHYERARRYIDAPRASAIIHCNSALCLQEVHRYNAAARRHSFAREVFDGEKHEATVAQIDYNHSETVSLRGRFREALGWLDRAEEVFERLGHRNWLGFVRLDRAAIYLQMGRVAEAADLARTASDTLEGTGEFSSLARSEFLQAVAAVLHDDGVGAESALSRAKALYGRLDSTVWRAECELLQATSRFERGNAEAAERIALRALAIFAAEGVPGRAASAEILLARVRLDAGDASRALELLDSAESRLRRAQAPWLTVEILRYRGLALIAASREDEGISALRGAIDTLESHRGWVPADEFMVSFLAGKAVIYTELMEALLAAGRDAESFEFCERAKSRSLVDLLSARESGLHFGLARGRGTLRQSRIRHLREELNVRYAKLHANTTGEDPLGENHRTKLAAEVDRRERDLATLLRQESIANPELASLTAVSSPSLATVRSLLDADTTLIEYFTAQDALHVFVVRPDNLIVRSLPIKSETLAARARRFHYHMRKFNLGEEYVDGASDLLFKSTINNLADLHAALWAPMAGDIVGSKVIVVPHGPLHGIPFHAMPDGDGGWLADRHQISYAPSAGVLQYCARKRVGRSHGCAVFGVDDACAPQILLEANEVARAYGAGADARMGADATIANLRAAAEGAEVLHIATHCQFHPEEPTLSRFRLADGWINLHDVYQMRIAASIVVLSACETGTARVTGGDEVIGLARGFLFAGAARLLASQWRVHDESAATLMSVFHESCRNGESYGSALQHAMRQLRGTKPHPYYWAPFFLIGTSAEPADPAPATR